MFNEDIKQLNATTNKAQKSSNDSIALKNGSGVITRAAAKQEYSHLPEGVGINGVVFETQRPDDPEAFANRHRERMVQKS